MWENWAHRGTCVGVPEETSGRDWPAAPGVGLRGHSRGALVVHGCCVPSRSSTFKSGRAVLASTMHSRGSHLAGQRSRPDALPGACSCPGDLDAMHSIAELNPLCPPPATLSWVTCPDQ